MNPTTTVDLPSLGCAKVLQGLRACSRCERVCKARPDRRFEVATELIPPINQRGDVSETQPG